MPRPAYLKKSVSGSIFDCLNVLLMLMLVFIMLYPFWNQFILSLNDGNDAKAGSIYWWPRIFTFANYVFVFKADNTLLRATLISVARVIAGVTTNLFCSGILAYVVSVRNFSGRRFVRFFMVISMYIPIALIPGYVLYSTLGLTNTFQMYWIPGLINVWNMLMIASYIQNQPEALIESARLDGARELQIYIKIIFPICVPVFAALAVFSAVGHWNAWFDVLVYNNKGRWDTLQMKLREILILNSQSADINDVNKSRELIENAVSTRTVQAATTMIVCVPILVVYPFLKNTSSPVFPSARSRGDRFDHN